jgi:hypothetical protein
MNVQPRFIVPLLFLAAGNAFGQFPASAPGAHDAEFQVAIARAQADAHYVWDSERATYTLNALRRLQTTWRYLFIGTHCDYSAEVSKLEIVFSGFDVVFTTSTAQQDATWSGRLVLGSEPMKFNITGKGASPEQAAYPYPVKVDFAPFFYGIVVTLSNGAEYGTFRQVDDRGILLPLEDWDFRILTWADSKAYDPALASLQGFWELKTDSFVTFDVPLKSIEFKIIGNEIIYLERPEGLTGVMTCGWILPPSGGDSSYRIHFVNARRRDSGHNVLPYKFVLDGTPNRMRLCFPGAGGIEHWVVPLRIGGEEIETAKRNVEVAHFTLQTLAAIGASIFVFTAILSWRYIRQFNALSPGERVRIWMKEEEERNTPSEPSISFSSSSSSSDSDNWAL